MTDAIQPALHPLLLLESEVAGPAGDRTLMDCFAAQLARRKDAVAVRDDTGEITYLQLDGAANQVAHALRRVSTHPSSMPVALLLESGMAQVTGIVGVLKAGHAYLPLDPHQPPARLQAILDDSGATLLVYSAGYAEQVGRIKSGQVTALALEGCSDLPRDDTGSNCSPDDPAYLLYTSGSTGTPKGVLISHRAAVHNVRQQARILDPGTPLRMAGLLSPAHGLAASLLFLCLLTGGTYMPFDLNKNGLRACASWLRDQRINLIRATPTIVLRIFDALAAGRSLPDLRYIWLGGEPVHRGDIERMWPRVAPRSRIVVGFASTETHAICELVIERDTALEEGVLPVGHPVTGKIVHILDDLGREVAAGETGEVWVESRYLADGYWRDASLTAARFESSDGETGMRRYRTGDMARRRSDGQIELRGRRDDQLKIRGFRVQPAETAAALRGLPGVKEAAVVVDRGHATPRLAGYVVAETQRGLDSMQIREELRDRLPDYLVPARIEIVDTLPFTGTGKLDVDALRAYDGPTVVADPDAAARTRTEAILLSSVRKLLPGSSIDLEQDFFSAGGDSLTAVALLARVEQIFQVNVPLGEFAAKPNLRWLGSRVESLRADPAHVAKDTCLEALVDDHPGAPLYLVPGGGGSEIELFLAYADLTAALGRERPVYGFRATSPDGRLIAGNTITQIVASFTRELREVQPSGPYTLLGDCGGGLIALEMGRRLIAAGEKVSLVLVDTDPSPPKPGIYRWVRHRIHRSGNTLRALRTRAAHHWRATAGMSWSERGAYLFVRSRSAARLVREQYQNTYHPERDVSRRIAAAREAYKQLILKFRPRPYPGPVTVLLSEDYLPLADAWRRSAQHGLRIVPLSGDHHSSHRLHAEQAARCIIDNFAPPEQSGA